MQGCCQAVAHAGLMTDYHVWPLSLPRGKVLTSAFPALSLEWHCPFQGVLYASPSSKDAASMLMYSPFNSWAANSDWQLSLPEGEEATAVAAGQTFCAVATSRRMLRLFSQAGGPALKPQHARLSMPGW